MNLHETVRELAATLNRSSDDGRTDAAALTWIGETESFDLAVGMANRQEDIAATPDTLFHVGSITKCLTAEIVWRLIEAGNLQPDMPVIAAAPELSPIASVADPQLKLRHLLSHTGGLDGDVIFDAGRDKDVLRRYLSEIREIGSLAAPGAHFSYANIGFAILGRIAELTAGAAYEQLLARLLRERHGLSHVAISPTEKIRRRTALHFYTEEGAVKPDLFGPHSNIASGTVLAMSMGDLARWGASHLPAVDSGEISSITQAMRDPAVELPHSHRYQGWGAGFTLFDDMGQSLFGHDGGTAGTAASLRIAPDRRTAWAFAATGLGAAGLYREIEPALRQLSGLSESPVRMPPGGPASGRLDRYEGVYGRHGVQIVVRKETEVSLVLAVSGPMVPPIINGLSLTPLTDQVFAAQIPALNATIWVSFHDYDAEGRPALIFLLERLARRVSS